MKIAQISPWGVRCGIYTYTCDLTKALADEDVESLIVRLPRFGQKDAAIMRDVAERVPKEVDLIHVQHEYGLYQGFEDVFYSVLRSYNKPIVTTMHAVGQFEIDILIAGASAKLIVHNEFCRSRVNYPNTVIIHHGVVQEQTPDIADAKKAIGVDPKLKVVGYLGFISNYKGLEVLVEAMTKVPDAGLVICGGWHTGKDTEYMEKLKEWSLKVLKNRVVWTGYVADKDLANAYGAMDVLVYPSRYVSESGALLHGIGYGRAIIAGNLEPNREKEKDGAIWTFKGIDDLVQKIRSLLNDEHDARKSLQEGARKYAKNNSWMHVAKQHVVLYEKVLNK